MRALRLCVIVVAAWAIGSACGRVSFEDRDAAAGSGVDAAPAWPSIGLAVDTGATADVVAIRSAHAADGATGLSAFGPEVEGILGPIVAADAVVWSKRLDQLVTGNPGATLPTDVDVVFAVDGAGTIAAVAVPRGPIEHALAVLTFEGLTTEYVATWGAPAGSVVHPYVDLDRRSNLLATFLFGIYVQEVNAGRISGGLAVVCSSYGCNWGTVVPEFDLLRFRIYNGFGDTVAVYLSVLFALQPQTMWGCGCPFDGIAFSASPWAPMFGALNQQWNPKPDPQADGSATRSFRITPANTPRASYLMALAFGDNQNMGSIALDGASVSQFANYMPMYQYHRVAGALPSTVTMQFTNNWSTGKVELRLAVIGTTLAFDQLAETPSAPSGDNNPAPIALELRPGWTE